jgi:hypothetical protein
MGKRIKRNSCKEGEREYEQIYLFHIGDYSWHSGVSLPLSDCERYIACSSFTTMACTLCNEYPVCPQYNHFSSILISVVQ